MAKHIALTRDTVTPETEPCVLSGRVSVYFHEAQRRRQPRKCSGWKFGWKSFEGKKKQKKKNSGLLLSEQREEYHHLRTLAKKRNKLVWSRRDMSVQLCQCTIT